MRDFFIFNSEVTIHAPYLPGNVGQPTHIAISKYSSSLNRLWTTGFTSSINPNYTPGGSIAENYKGQLLCQFINGINTAYKNTAVAFIDTNGTVGQNCQLTFSYYDPSLFNNTIYGSQRLQGLKNNTFFQENIPAGNNLNPLNFVKLNIVPTSTCISTTPSSLTGHSDISIATTAPFGGISTINSYTISPCTSTISSAPLNINTTGCTYSDVSVKEYDPNSNLLTTNPNPASEILKFKLANPMSISRIKIINVNGEIIKDQLETSEINVSGLPTGLYVIQIVSSSGIYSAKFIKE